MVHSHEKHDAGVCHGEGQAQDTAAHDGVAQVEDRHSKGSVTRMLLREKRKGISLKAVDGGSASFIVARNVAYQHLSCSLRRTGNLCSVETVIPHNEMFFQSVDQNEIFLDIYISESIM